MRTTSLIAAVGTPLTGDESLHVEGLEAHLADQWRSGMTGILVGGTMGAMQLLTDATYRRLVDAAIRISKGQGEVMVGVGDCGLARTRQRIELLNQYSVDGVVILTPFFFRFSQPELVAYFNALADESRNPVFLYDLPTLTGTKLELATVQQLARNSKIRGIKCSGDLGAARQLIDLVPKQFRVILAQADLVDVLLRHGITEHLDGVFALAPAWVSAIAKAAAADDWNAAGRLQRRVSALLRVLKQYGVFQTFTLLLNARGIGGSFMPAPLRPLTRDELADIMNESIVQELLSENKNLSHQPAVQPAPEFLSAK